MKHHHQNQELKSIRQFSIIYLLVLSSIIFGLISSGSFSFFIDEVKDNIAQVFVFIIVLVGLITQVLKQNYFHK